jgi:hypothetical protein
LHCYRETPQCFIMGQNLERAMGQGSLSGLSLKLSGYSVHLQMSLRTAGAYTLASDDQKFREPNVSLWGKQMNLLVVMLHDKSVVLRNDAITVSE